MAMGKMYNKSVLPNALNAVNTALLKAFSDIRRQFDEREIQVITVLGKNEHLKISLLQETC
jgi:hypothetical protein